MHNAAASSWRPAGSWNGRRYLGNETGRQEQHQQACKAHSTTAEPAAGCRRREGKSVPRAIRAGKQQAGTDARDPHTASPKRCIETPGRRARDESSERTDVDDEQEIHARRADGGVLAVVDQKHLPLASGNNAGNEHGNLAHVRTSTTSENAG